MDDPRRIEQLTFTVTPDPMPDLGYVVPEMHDPPEERAAKQGRLQALENGQWEPVVVRCEVLVCVRLADGREVCHTLISPGTWNLQSDDPVALEFARGMEFDVMRETLAILGFDADEIVRALYRDVPD